MIRVHEETPMNARGIESIKALTTSIGDERPILLMHEGITGLKQMSTTIAMFRISSDIEADVVHATFIYSGY